MVVPEAVEGMAGCGRSIEGVAEASAGKSMRRWCPAVVPFPVIKCLCQVRLGDAKGYKTVVLTVDYEAV